MKRKAGFLWILTAVFIFGFGVTPVYAADTVTSRSMVVESVSGSDAKLTKGTSKTYNAKAGTRLASGYTMNTGKETTANLKMDDKSTVAMDHSTMVAISKVSNKEVMLTVVNGSIAVNAAKQNEGDTTSIKAGNTTMGIRGTLFTVSCEGGVTRVTLLEGRLEVSTPGNTYLLTAGHVLEVSDSLTAQGQVTDVYPLNIEQENSFTLEIIKENINMLTEIGIINAEEAKHIDELITEKKAEEKRLEDEANKNQPAVNVPQTQIYLPDSTPAQTTGGINDNSSNGIGTNDNSSESNSSGISDNSSGSNGSGSSTPGGPYTVTFTDWDKSILKAETVAHGGTATPPANPTRAGYTFTGWDVAYTNVTCSLTVTAQYTQNAGPGDGTPGNPFKVGTVADLMKVGSETTAGGWTLAANYVLMNDINTATGYNQVIGTASDPFTGSFDGGGHTITVNINLSGTDCVGLFGYIDGSTVKDLTVDGTITGRNVVGSLVGTNNGGTIENCRATGSVSGNDYVGGLAGDNYGGIIADCYATGTVTGTGSYCVGGLVGYNNYGGIITDCYATGAVTGNGNIGGLAGVNYKSTITGCHATGNVEGTNDYVGGLVGNNTDGTIENCYATGTVSGSDNVGGLAGTNYDSGIITDCHATGTVSGNSNVGGLAGTNYKSTITGCHATGTVSGSNYVGGLVGYNDLDGTIINCQALNPSVEAAGGSNAGRVAGGSDGTLNDNYANAAMLVNGSIIGSGAGTSSNIDGADIITTPTALAISIRPESNEAENAPGDANVPEDAVVLQDADVPKNDEDNATMDADLPNSDEDNATVDADLPKNDTDITPAVGS